MGRAELSAVSPKDVCRLRLLRTFPPVPARRALSIRDEISLHCTISIAAGMAETILLQPAKLTGKAKEASIIHITVELRKL